MTSCVPWTSEEDHLVAGVYQTVPFSHLRAALPHRTSAAIRHRAIFLGVAGLRQLGKNRYKITATHAVIFLERRNGDVLETKVDKSDLRMLLDYGRWYATTPQFGNVYAKCGSVRLHQLLVRCPPGFEVDHIHGDTLDNRRRQLRRATRAQNVHNRTAVSRGVVGHRNVKKSSDGRYFVACITAGKQRHSVAVKSKNDAVRIAVSLKKSLHPFCVRY
jgi:hypothetical protein